MKISNVLIDNLKDFEGYSLTAYRDSAGLPTIGIGHRKGVKMGDKITAAQAIQFLDEDLAESEHYVDGLHLTLTQGQYDALVDFSFNSGIGNLMKSRLLKLIRANINDKNIPAEFMLWARDHNGNTPKGLVRRKRFEAERWQSKY